MWKCKDCDFEFEMPTIHEALNMNCCPNKKCEGLNIAKLNSESLKHDSNILDSAKNILFGDRDSDYGDFVQNFKEISAISKILTRKDLTPEDCCKVLIAVKLAREGYKHKEDNLIDLCGYTNILNEIYKNKENNNE